MPFGSGSGTGRKRLYSIFFGVPNLSKRLQAPAILKCISNSKPESVLDYGCASGLLSVELGRRFRRVVAVDMNPDVISIRVPSGLEGCLEYRQATSPLELENLGPFDCILLSDVINMQGDPKKFLEGLTSLLKPGGSLVVAQGLGRPITERLFQAPGHRILKLALGRAGIRSFADYERSLQVSFGNPQGVFLGEESITSLLSESRGLEVVFISHPISHTAGRIIEFQQALRVALKRNPVGSFPFFVLYELCRLGSLIDRRKWSGMILIEAKRVK